MQAFAAAATWRRNRKTGIEGGTTMLNSKRCDWKIDTIRQPRGVHSGKKETEAVFQGQVGKHHCSSVYRLYAENFFMMCCT